MKVDKIIVHCSASPPSVNYDIDALRRTHVDHNGWSDIGYHEYITRDGALHLGRDLDGNPSTVEKGAHCYGMNNGSYAICMEGGVDEDGNPQENFTHEQWKMFRFRICELLSLFLLTANDVYGHNDLDPGKACPSFSVSHKLFRLEID